jgi:hypothetical protein
MLKLTGFGKRKNFSVWKSASEFGLKPDALKTTKN